MISVAAKIKKTSKDKKLALAAQLPSSVSIFGREIKVLVTTLKGLHGDFTADTNTIRIHQTSDIYAARATLFHEAIHAALTISGQNEMMKEDQEEGLVRCLEHAFMHIVDIDKLALDK